LFAVALVQAAQAVTVTTAVVDFLDYLEGFFREVNLGYMQYQMVLGPRC
jgi:hypothetical protein